jgi:hypothetical protein
MPGEDALRGFWRELDTLVDEYGFDPLDDQRRRQFRERLEAAYFAGNEKSFDEHVSAGWLGHGAQDPPDHWDGHTAYAAARFKWRSLDVPPAPYALQLAVGSNDPELLSAYSDSLYRRSKERLIERCRSRVMTATTSAPSVITATTAAIPMSAPIAGEITTVPSSEPSDADRIRGILALPDEEWSDVDVKTALAVAKNHPKFSYGYLIEQGRFGAPAGEESLGRATISRFDTGETKELKPETRSKFVRGLSRILHEMLQGL